jgi:hypothetical protein
MSTIHIMLQGKGGVGKSLASALLVQFLEARGIAYKGFDTDPVNGTFSQFRGLDVERVDIMEGTGVNERHFDGLIETLVEFTGDVVVDNGATSFLAMSNYLKENHVIPLLAENGKQVLIHTIITGGQAQSDTLSGYRALAEQLTDAKIVVWLNPFFGEISMEGKEFEDFSVYKKAQPVTLGVVRIPQRNRDTFGRDVEEMIRSKLTFEEAIAQARLMTKQRLKTVRTALFAELERVLQSPQEPAEDIEETAQASSA